MADAVAATFPLEFPWTTFDPFLFCAWHDDDYPAGDDALGPVEPLAGREIGRDFSRLDGWSMYHGSVVPGFPQHPHRGFETVTLVRRGFVDHSDSLGATGRLGPGDVQWMTAGSGIVHAEMFPLVNTFERNPTELFQIWLNLPAHDKLVPPYFTMFWGETLPKVTVRTGGAAAAVTLVAGGLDGNPTAAPPPDSWASRPENEVAIWPIQLAPGARFTLPAVSRGVDRTLYVFGAGEVQVGGAPLRGIGARLAPEVAVELVCGPVASEVLLLQGRPIREPVAHYGPFVMNTREELEVAFEEYRRTGFGDWPWGRRDPVHTRDEGRFALHADGTREKPST